MISLFSMKINIQIIFILCILLIPISSECSSPCSLYYAKFNDKVTSGILSATDLVMVPAENEYRTETFRCIKITGTSDNHLNSNPENTAKRNAIAILLTRHGLRSVKNRKNLANNRSFQDETVMSYEGVLKYPFKILNKGYLEDGKTYHIEMEFWFSPVAFPDRWSFLYYRNMVKNAFHEFISFF